MFFTILIFGLRAQNITHEQYKAHYENTHIPLAKSLSGAAWPLSHTRHYFGGNKTLASISYPVDWDSMAVLKFSNESHAFKWSYLVGLPDAAKAIEEDEKEFMATGSPRTVVIGTDTEVTVP